MMKYAPAVALSVLGLVSIALWIEETPRSLRASRPIAYRLALVSEQTIGPQPDWIRMKSSEWGATL